MCNTHVSPRSEGMAMAVVQSDFDILLGEHIALCRQYGTTQAHCSEMIAAQRAETARLDAEVVRLRAAVVVRDTALALAREERASFEAGIAGLPRRVALAQRVDALLARIQALMRERLHWQWHGAPVMPPAAPPPLFPVTPSASSTAVRQKAVLWLGKARRLTAAPEGEATEDLAALEASLVAADLVICQTGCLSHGAYWRVQDHCRRTGKTCVMVDDRQATDIAHGG